MDEEIFRQQGEELERQASVYDDNCRLTKELAEARELVDCLRHEIAPLACIGGDALHCHHDGCPFELAMWQAIQDIIKVVDFAPEGGWHGGMEKVEDLVKSFRPKGQNDPGSKQIEAHYNSLYVDVDLPF